MKQSSANTHRPLEIMIHIISWGMILGFPLFFMEREGRMDIGRYLHHSAVPFSFLIVFYLNYFFLIPRFLFKNQKKQYILYNILLVCLAGLALHLWQSIDAPVRLNQRHNLPPRWLFFIRDIVTLVFTIGLSAAIRMSSRWQEAEAARREAERSRTEAEKSRTEAELKNLRNQLNPHFLLNTLNNIYALIAFNGEKAQAAVQELSKLLRYVLYENQHTYVPLCKEAEFIRNYVELMRIRLSGNIEVTTCLNITPDSQTEIAPLLFISLIENAFKHGISPTEPSFIHIELSETGKEIICEIHNSCHSKTSADKSGSGIGLEQVTKRLELLYAHRYSWDKGVSEDGKEYRSKLCLQPRKNNSL